MRCSRESTVGRSSRSSRLTAFPCVSFLSRQLGHASPAITLDVYAHLFDLASKAEQHRAKLAARHGKFVEERDGNGWETTGAGEARILPLAGILPFPASP